MPPQEPQQPNPTPTEPVVPTPEAAPAPTTTPEVSTEPQPAVTPEPAPAPHNSAPASNEDPGHTMGIVGLVLAFFMPLVGLIVSIVARSKSKKAGHKNTIATVGIVVNLLFMIMSALFSAIIIFGAMKGVQTIALDTEAQSDINMQHAQLEAYYQKNGSYPSSIDMLTDLSPDAVVTPEGYTYVYGPTPAGCTQCTGYTLETQLSTGDVYRKEALNSF